MCPTCRLASRWASVRRTSPLSAVRLYKKCTRPFWRSEAPTSGTTPSWSMPCPVPLHSGPDPPPGWWSEATLPKKNKKTYTRQRRTSNSGVELSHRMEMKFEEVFNDRPSPLEKRQAGWTSPLVWSPLTHVCKQKNTCRFTPETTSGTQGEKHSKERKERRKYKRKWRGSKEGGNKCVKGWQEREEEEKRQQRRKSEGK